MKESGSFGLIQAWKWKKIELLDRLLGRIALLPNGSTTAHWDTATKYWSIVLHRLLKYKEIPDFQSKLLLLSSKRVTDLENSRVWSLGPSGRSSEIPFSSPCPHLPRWTKLHSKLFGRPAAKESQHINLDYGFQSPKLFLDHSEKTPRQVLAALSVPSLYEGQRVWAFDGSLCSNVFQKKETLVGSLKHALALCGRHTKECAFLNAPCLSKCEYQSNQANLQRYYLNQSSRPASDVVSPDCFLLALFSSLFGRPSMELNIETLPRSPRHHEHNDVQMVPHPRLKQTIWKNGEEIFTTKSIDPNH
uniref:Uncharacterized protein n=1 Tax=Cucumis melo TaxID=3656 RepID=A0A9I9EHG1_CUCME